MTVATYDKKYRLGFCPYGLLIFDNENEWNSCVSWDDIDKLHPNKKPIYSGINANESECPGGSECKCNLNRGIVNAFITESIILVDDGNDGWFIEFNSVSGERAVVLYQPGELEHLIRWHCYQIEHESSYPPVFMNDCETLH